MASCQDENGERIWVAKHDESLQCEPESGISIEEMGEELEKRGISVHESMRVDDGKMRAQECGLETGWLNAYEISQSDEADARGLGFEPLEDLQDPSL